MISLTDIIQARENMKGVVHTTPLDSSKTFSDIAKNEVYLKLENLQKTGSFKVRGSYNKLISIPKSELDKGVIAASAGNHAQGVAYSSRILDIPCTIVMPKGAPLSKIQATKRYGAKVELYGKVFDEALEFSKRLKDETGAAFIHAFDDEAVIAGQGTVGLEVLEQLSDVEAVICPVGGGGLIAGVGMAIKEMNPAVKVYGVEALACSSMKSSLDAKKPMTVEAMPTMADGIAVKRPGNLTFELIQKYVDDVFCVDEMEIARSMLMLLERNKLLVEGSGASSLAALLYEKLPLQNKKVVAVLSGGNVDVNFISRIIQYGMVEAGRYIQIETVIKDKPGELERLLQIVSELEGNILDLNLQHMGVDVFPGHARLIMSIETKDSAHIEKIENELLRKGYKLRDK
ncbi:threonine ammonia-lyase [Cytobacillus sp. FJAT-54145]|uniref:threonine ammonia-lyase n=1 Tax=Cytobacillus spartinae TaxID=3299023 RepID=A0ABW6KB06_9BACI